ncbi:MAG: MmgE/PrpD family protein [Thermodesulfobacteriota bacterium]
MNALNKKSPIDELIANALETRFENIDPATLAHAKNRIVDVIGCLIGGANGHGNLPLIKLIKDWGGKEEATILIHGGKAPACNVAMVNSIMARSYDFEPVDVLVDNTIIPAHISGTTVMTAIAMGELKGINGKELITALLVGDDVAARVLAASGFGFGLGWDNTGTVNAFGAAAIAGRLMGLNRLHMRDAFGIVLNQLAGSFQNIWDGTTAFKLQQGISARNGIFSAQLAKSGWTGPQDALLAKFSYYHLYTEGCRNLEILTKDLGKKYYSDVTFKPYPCCRTTHPAINCALALIHKNPVDPQNIKEVILRAPRGALDSFCGQPFKIGRFSHGNANFSYYYTVANALLRKSVKPEHFSDESIADPQIKALIGKMTLEELSGASFQSAGLKIIMKDGKEFSEFTDTPKGHSTKNPMSKDEIIAKFWTNVEFSQTVTRKNADRLLTLLGNLEELDQVDRIVELLVV